MPSAAPPMKGTIMPHPINPCAPAQPCANCPYNPANANLAQQLMMHIEQMGTSERRQMVMLIDAILAASQRPANARATPKTKRSKKH